MPEQNSRDWVEVLVAIGRIEEGIKSVRDSIDRLELIIEPLNFLCRKSQ